MKRIACHSRAVNNLSFLGACVTLLALGATAVASLATASTRPQTGGTLRVQIGERIDTLDPRQWPADRAQGAMAEQVAALVFDRLIRVDDRGALQPALAVSWQHDAQSKRWQFRMREAVKFSDGTPLTPSVAASALQQVLGASFDVSAISDSVVVQADQSLPDLASQLASGRYFIFHAGDDGSLAGTGPFRFMAIESVGRAAGIRFDASESCWAGRPFLDKIILSMNVDSGQQANALAFGQADVVELPASQVRRAAQRGIRTASSDPVDLLALVFADARPGVQDARVRHAVSLAIDRTSIADVILQRQGLVARSLLPNWISGYAHLFSASFDVPRAKELLAASGRELPRSLPLVLVYDSGDAEARAVADRVAVNLREVGIVMQVSGQSADGKAKPPAADLRLIRHRVGSPDPAAALSDMLRTFGEPATSLETIEQDYQAERATIDAFRVIPLVHVTENYGLSPQVRDWMAPRWGGWNLADVWLGPPSATGGGNP